MKNILSLMVTQKKSNQKKEALISASPSQIKQELHFIPYINYGSIYDEFQKSKRTRNLIMTPEDEVESKVYLFDDKDYVSYKLIHEKREHLTPAQNRSLVKYTLKLLIPQKNVNEFKKQGFTIKKIAEFFMVHTNIIYMRLNLTG
ncbi:MAG: hypothetical protein GQ546_12060 [Gammaproteobacteria bacterium]|jgi:hypothetical protein|nr:hypothetical protein [Gammaproteobacteria bacterium]